MLHVFESLIQMNQPCKVSAHIYSLQFPITVIHKLQPSDAGRMYARLTWKAHAQGTEIVHRSLILLLLIIKKKNLEDLLYNACSSSSSRQGEGLYVNNIFMLFFCFLSGN